MGDWAARLAAAAVMGVAASAPAGTGEWLVGAGVDDVSSDGDGTTTAGFGIELRSDPLLSAGIFELRAGAAAEADLDADLWAGGGPVLTLSAGAWRLGASVMPGVYAEGDGNNLGGAFEIRSQVFADRAISDRARLGLAFAHKSNASQADDNPGVETLLVTYGRSF